MAEGYPIGEGHLDINADPSRAIRNVRDFLHRVDLDLHRQEDDFAESGRRSGRRYGEGLNEGLRGATGGNLINDLLLPNGGGGGGGEGGGGGGGGFIQGLISGISGGFRRLLDEIRTLIADIESLLSGLGGGGGGGFLSDLQDAFTNLISNIRSGFNSMISYMHGTWTRFIGFITGGTGHANPFSGWITSIRAMWTRFATWGRGALTATWTRVRTFFTNMGTGLRGFWTRFSTWAVITFATMRHLASSFWSQFRSRAMSVFTTLALVAGILFSRMRGWASSLFTRMRSWFSSVWTRGSARARSIWTRLAGWARSAITTIGGWFSNLFSSISSWASTAFTQLSSAMSSLSSAAGAAGPLLQVGMYAMLVPMVLGLGGAIAQLLPLLLLLPAAIATLVSVIAPAIVAFKGFGEAVGAGLSGDMEKFNEALKKLTPSARAVAKEFVKLGPALKNIKKQTQEALFKPLIGTIKPLATTLLPALATGMARVGGALGRLLAGFARMLATPEVISAINALFATTERIVDRLGPPLASLFGALFGTVEGGLPWIEKLVDTIADGITKAAEWLREIKGNGQMQSWLQKAWDAAKTFWDLIVALGELIGSLFGAGGNEGLSWLEDLTAMVKKLTDYFKSAEGVEFLENLVSWMDESGGLMLWGVDVLMKLFNAISAIINVAQATPGFLRDMWQGIKDAAKAVGDWFAMIGRVSWDWIKDAASAVKDFFVGIGRWIADAYHTVVGWGAAILDWFSKIPGWVGTFFSNLPGYIADGLQALSDAIFYGIGWIAGFIVGVFMSIPGWISTAWDAIVSAVSSGVSSVVETAKTLPGKILEGITSLSSTVMNFLDGVWDSAFESTSRWVQRTWESAKQLPGKIGNALSELPGKVSSAVNDAWTKGKDATLRGVDGAVNHAKGLPGKIGNALAGAGNWLVSVGRDMIRGLVNGIAGAMDWAVNQAKRAASKIAEGFKDALGISSPSRLMRVEVGRELLPGAMMGIRDTIPEAQRYLGTVANMMVGGFQPTVNVAAPNVHTGDVMLTADLGEGIRQVVPLVITRSPRVVAGANAVGTRQRSGWANTGRGQVR